MHASAAWLWLSQENTCGPKYLYCCSSVASTGQASSLKSKSRLQFSGVNFAAECKWCIAIDRSFLSLFFLGRTSIFALFTNHIPVTSIAISFSAFSSIPWPKSFLYTLFLECGLSCVRIIRRQLSNDIVLRNKADYITDEQAAYVAGLRICWPSRVGLIIMMIDRSKMW